MTRWQLFLSAAKAALVTAFGGSWLFSGAKAQTRAAAVETPVAAASALRAYVPTAVIESWGK